MKNAANNVRIVVDTNLFISAIVFGGLPRKLLDLVAEDRVIVVIAEEILTEIRRIIAVKFSAFLPDLAKVERLLDEYAVWVRLGTISLSVSRDSDDDKFIETAIVGNCQFIVSGDRDLLDLKMYKGVKIVNAAEFLSLVKTSDQI